MKEEEEFFDESPEEAVEELLLATLMDNPELSKRLIKNIAGKNHQLRYAFRNLEEELSKFSTTYLYVKNMDVKNPEHLEMLYELFPGFLSFEDIEKLKRKITANTPDADKLAQGFRKTLDDILEQSFEFLMNEIKTKIENSSGN